jgi:glycerol-3-phosphate dehydrogenase (NAD(P)+)
MTDAHSTTTSDAITVLGAGSWGTALAIILARKSYRVLLWGHDAAHMAMMAAARENTRYLSGIPFPSTLSVSADLGDATRATPRLLVAVPSHAFRATLTAMRPHLPTGARVAWATKGFEPGGSRRLSEVAQSLIAGVPWAVISGPTFAREVANRLPCALTVASPQAGVAEEVAGWLRNEHLRAYTTHDAIGVEVGGAVKNVMAIAAGISDGLGFGANARAALITRGLAELRRLGLALGGLQETFMGLSGVGDLILTCTDNTSRNRQVGLGLGQGRSLETILRELGQVAEGVGTAREVLALARRVGVDMPITEQVSAVLFEGQTAQAAVEALLRREARPE